MNFGNFFKINNSFKCLDEVHPICSCFMVKLWRKKCQDDSETSNWISSHAKSCPKCGKFIEKNGGCNHISCSCGHHFCWVCEGDFDHKTYKHSCGRYIDDEKKEKAKYDLHRYLHYYQRYQNHKESRAKESQIRTKTKSKMDEIYKIKKNSSWIDIQWLNSALETLFHCRKILQWSYCFGFYLFDPSSSNEEIKKITNHLNSNQKKVAKNLFEDHQESLENATEQLSSLIELPVDKICFDSKTKDDIIKYTVSADKRMKALVDIIEKEINEFHGEFTEEEREDKKRKGINQSFTQKKKKKKKAKSISDEDDELLQLAIQESLK